MNKEEFYRWKHDGKEVFQVIRDTIKGIEYNLSREAGIDSGNDRFKAGMIKGIEMVLEIDWEDTDDSES